MISDITDSTTALWDPTTGRVFTFMLPYDGLDAPLRSAWGRETFDELLAAGSVSPESVLIPWSEALPMQEAAERARCCTGPQSIDAARFDELLNCLPPQRWFCGDLTETFRISEPVTGSLYTYCVRLRSAGKDYYFTLTEVDSISHYELVKLCRAKLPTAA